MEIENKQDAGFSPLFSQIEIAAAPIKRILASLINTIGLYAWGFLLIVVVGAVIGVVTDLDEFAADETLLTLVFLAILSYWALQLYLMITRGQTLGKMLMKIQAVDFSTNQPLTFGRYFGREIVEALIYGILPPIIFVNVVMLWANKDRRTLTDMLFSTIVVEKL